MTKPNIFDRAVAAVAPVHAMKRAAARAALDFSNSGYGNYGASQTKKTMKGWLFRGGSSKEDIEDNLSVLRQRSRDAYMGVPVANSALKTLRTNVLAGGLIPSPKIDFDFLGMPKEIAQGVQTQIMREFSLWADTPSCDTDRIDNFYKLQSLAYMGYLMNGDSISLLPVEQNNGQQPYGLRINVIEADRVCSPDGQDRLFPCRVYGYDVYRIVQGIETDEHGAVVAYWICNHHPLSNNYISPGKQNWVRVETFGRMTGRRNLVHVMNRERAGQLRGVPLLAPVIETLKQLGRYTEAEIQAAVISSYFTVFVEPENATDAPPFGEVIPKDQQVDADDERTIEMGTGAIVGLMPGEKVSFADPKHPSTGFDRFYDSLTKQIGAALEIPVEVMQKQFTTSYSAARGALNEFWRTCGMERDAFADDFCQPIYEEWFAEAVARGRIYAPGFFSDPAIRKAYTGCTWNGPARTNLNPLQEVQAAAMMVEHGFSTAQEQTAQMTGGDWNQNIQQRVIEAQRKREVDDISHPELLQTNAPQSESEGQEQ